jgi:monoterpene epsilon-lactone hydrolase
MAAADGSAPGLLSRVTPSRASALRLPPGLVRLTVPQIGRRVLNPGLPWEAQRRRLDQVARTTPVPRGTNVAGRVLNGIPTEVVTASGARPERTVLHLHGGGYCIGSPRMMRTWAAHLSARAACRVVVPDYRLAPAHPHPAGLDDARAVMDALLGEGAAASIVVSGDSAGGGLALSLLLARRDAGERLPAGCMLASPWLDLSRDRRAVPRLVRREQMLSPGWLEACALAYAPRAAWAIPSVSPLLAGHVGLPPLLIQAGSDELLAPDAERLAASASAAGADVTYTRWPGMWHDFILQPGLVAAADSAVAQAAWFVETVTGRS